MRLALLLILLATNALGIAAQAADLPTGGVVVAAGSASITPGTNSLRINQGSDRAVINWNSFDVGAGNTVQFVQPTSSSAILNRVVAANPSQIHGQITANGRVFLVNPNGIVVGTGGRIDASGIFLTTASIADADFLAGNLRFETPPPEAAIVVAGQLDARYVLNIHAGTTDLRDRSVLDAASININNPPFTEAVVLTITGMNAANRIYDSNAGASSGVVVFGGDALTYPISGSISLSGIPSTSSLSIASAGQATQFGGTISVSSGSGLAVYSSTIPPPPALPKPQKVIPPFSGGITSLRSTMAIPAMPLPQATLPLSTAPAVPAAAPAAASVKGTGPAVRPGNAGGLVDGAVTVRMSLVDASPIMLR